MSKINYSYRNKIRTHLLESSDIKKQIADKCLDSILRAAEIIVSVFQSGGKLLICGNGGSAADCQHMASEFVSLLNKDFNRPPLPAIALTTDTSFLTASANDFGFDGVFKRQVQALGKPGDLLIAISTSGKSKNVLRATKAAKMINMKTIILTGTSSNLHIMMADVIVAVPSTNTQYIQEGHLAIEHILCELVEHQLFGEKPSGKNKTYGNK